MTTTKITSFPSFNSDQGHGWQKPGRHKKDKITYNILCTSCIFRNLLQQGLPDEECGCKHFEYNCPQLLIPQVEVEIPLVTCES